MNALLSPLGKPAVFGGIRLLTALYKHAKSGGPQLVKPQEAPAKFDFEALAKQAAWDSATVPLSGEGLGVLLEGDEVPVEIEGPPSSGSTKRQGQSHSNARRAKRRKLEKLNAGPGPSPSTYAHVLSHGTAIEVEADATKLPAAKGAVTGKRGTVGGAWGCY